MGRSLVMALVCLGLALPSLAQSEVSQVYEQAVVGLDVTFQPWDEDRPWAKRGPRSRRANAVLVDDGLLLTTAQMVDQAAFIQLVVAGRSRPVEPRPVLVDRSINLALLRVEAVELLEGLQPARLAPRTPTSGSLRTVRWRRQQLEAAASRVARFDVAQSWASSIEHAFLHMTTDLSAGGWSEPVFEGPLLVGLTVSQSEQRSRAIPVEIIRQFLERARLQPYVPFAGLGFQWQVNRDPSVSRFLGQQGEPEGILLRAIPWGASGCGVLQSRDVLLELDGKRVDAEGYYTHEYLGKLRIGHHIAERRRPGDRVRARVLRAGREIELEVTLNSYPAELDLIPKRREGQPPYAIVGGLVLRELDVPYLQTWRDWSEQAPISLRGRYFFEQDAQSAQRRRIVLLTSVLPSEYNIGYEGLSDQVIESVNGTPVASLRGLLESLRHPLDRFHVIDLAPGSLRGRIALDADGLAAATEAVLEEYGVPAAVYLPDRALPPGGGDCRIELSRFTE